MEYPVTEPDVQGLVPPLLACLLTASFSRRPSPTLLALLSPVLSQRVQLLCDDQSDACGSWITLLSWDDRRGQELFEGVRDSLPEPHPVSGEVEYKCQTSKLFRRVDNETVQAKVMLEEPPLNIIYSWCSGSAEGEPGWKVHELCLTDENAHNEYSGWGDISTLADKSSKPAARTANDAEDGYWDQYDAKLEKSASNESLSGPSASAKATTSGVTLSDDAFYAQYEEVQPALDDPSQQLDQHRSLLQVDERDDGHIPVDNPHSQVDSEDVQVQSESKPSADTMRAQQQVNLQTGIKEHVRRTVQNLHELALTSGMGDNEFKDIVRAELVSLSSSPLKYRRIE